MSRRRETVKESGAQVCARLALGIDPDTRADLAAEGYGAIHTELLAELAAGAKPDEPSRPLFMRYVGIEMASWGDASSTPESIAGALEFVGRGVGPIPEIPTRDYLLRLLCNRLRIPLEPPP